MAIEFNAPAFFHATTPAADVTTTPITLGCMFNVPGPALFGQNMVCVCISGVHAQFWTLNTEADGTVAAATFNSTSLKASFSSTLYAPGNWYQATGVFAAGNASRIVYLNGVAGAPENTNWPLLLSPNQILLGAENVNGVLDGFYSGCMAQAFIYKGEASAAQAAALAGQTPAQVFAGDPALIHYWPMVTDFTAAIGANATPSGPFTLCPTSPPGGAALTQIYELGLARRSFKGWRRSGRL